jgi:HD-GYP domain-containing protein (c-di-GMP phosphodiesterase class II)
MGELHREQNAFMVGAFYFSPWPKNAPEEVPFAMVCSEEELGKLALGASLHDIGKIGIPDAILLKPGKLNPEETEIMRRHVNISYDHVSQHLFLSHAAQIVLTHHEFYDGSGYPQGLVGNEIPLGARIFAVADTLDAMTSDRPIASPSHAESHAKKSSVGSGSQFDPDVVQAFLAIPEEVWNRIRAESDLETYSHRIKSCFTTP